MSETIRPKDESPGGEKWERVIENIVRKSTASIRVGIFGLEYCQLCGERKSYDGWCLAVATHMTVNGKKEFCCSACLKDSPGGPLSYCDHRRAQTTLSSRPFRYCQICGDRMEIDLKDSYDETVWACSRCKPKMSEKDFWAGTLRRRYVEDLCKTYEQLCSYDIQLETQRLELEETIDPKARSRRAERVRAAVAELERIHEKKYLHLIPDEDRSR